MNTKPNNNNKLEINKPKNIIISKSKITNINIIIKKWILKEFWIFPKLKKPHSKEFNFWI